MAPVFRNALPLQSRLHEYRIEQVLGAGGFGITYRARDVNLDKDVALKEYLPGELAMRAPDGNVVAQATEREAGYQWGLERFVQEARTLGKFSHPNIVRVLRYFEANATAYVVMDYESGDPLKTVLQLDPQPPESKLKAWLGPLLDGLGAVHAAGFLHRDIKPDNIFIRSDGKPVLIDFGAARQALGGETKSLTSILTPGYAPLEQYSGEGKQGPWTDLYAMGGVLYRAVTDKNPPDAVSRIRGDTLGSGLQAARGRYSPAFLQAIEWALQLDEKKRPQSVAQWKESTLAERRTAPVVRREPDIERRAEARTVLAAAAKRPRRWPYIVGVVILAVLAADIWRKNRASRIEAQRFEKERIQEEEAKRRDEHERQMRQLAAAAQKAKERAPARPDPAPAGAPGDRFAERTLQEFKTADANRDGYLSIEEARAKFPFMAQHFQRIDRNGDGRVSPEEFIQAKRAVLEKRFGK
jgi:serine/threonine protein kinase